MARKLLSLLLTLGLVAMFAACSDDDNGKPDSYVPPDAGPPPDSAPPDTAPPSETAPPDQGGDVETDGPAPDAGPVYTNLVALIEWTGTVSGMPVRFGGHLGTITRVSPADPDDTYDYIDSPTVPNCNVRTWKAGEVKKGNSWDAGKLTIKGHKSGADGVVYIDRSDWDMAGTACGGPTACTLPQYCSKADSACANPKPIPATFEGNRVQTPNTTTQWEYDWGMPALGNTLLLASQYDAATTVDISAAGGADVPAFSETGVPVAAAPNVTTDLTKINPSTKACTADADCPEGSVCNTSKSKCEVKIVWSGTVANAAFVAIWIKTMVADGSEFADITCSTLAVAGSKQVPAEALDLIPKPGTTADKAVIIKTVVLGVSAKGQAPAWGDYKVGAGQGKLGVTCVSPLGAGPCP